MLPLRPSIAGTCRASSKGRQTTTNNQVTRGNKHSKHACIPARLHSGCRQEQGQVCWAPVQAPAECADAHLCPSWRGLVAPAFCAKQNNRTQDAVTDMHITQAMMRDQQCPRCWTTRPNCGSNLITTASDEMSNSWLRGSRQHMLQTMYCLLTHPRPYPAVIISWPYAGNKQLLVLLGPPA